MNTEPRGELVEVRRCAKRDQAELYALVLSARGIASAIGRDADGFNLLVTPDDADQAKEEIAAYDWENQTRSTERKRVRSTPPNVEFLLAYWAVLLFFFAAGRSGALSIEWLEIGSGRVDLIRAGEWWRTVTALFLHASGMHLLSNLVFGTVFLLLLSQVLGPGMTALSVLAAGAAGNVFDALVRPSSHTFIGSSTAIFAAVGLLAALRHNWRRKRMFSTLRDWAPIAGGIMLLAFLGFGDGQTDILAHVFGFVSGVCLGALLAWLDRPWPEDSPAQAWSAWASGGIAVLAWLCAILVQA
jgi:membrane associated rhomboid family serine protease